QFPIPEMDSRLVYLSRRLDALANQSLWQTPEIILKEKIDGLPQRLLSARNIYEQLHRQMIAVQDEIDWLVYGMYGLCEYSPASDDSLKAGFNPEDRPVERLLKAKIGSGTNTIFYDVHRYRGTGHFHYELSPEMSELINCRLRLIESNAQLCLIETLNYKRRWQVKSWEDQEQQALLHWLLDRLESTHYWPDPAQTPELTSCTRLAERAARDTDFLQVAALYRG